MKKIIFLIFFLICNSSVCASNYSEVYISKKDLDTNLFLNDCSFVIYDMNNNVIDSWITNDEVHVVSLEFGDYKLVETPILDDKLVYDLSNFYDISVSDGSVMELTLYNDKIDTPKNLGIDNNYLYIGSLFIIVGLLITLSRKFYYN